MVSVDVKHHVYLILTVLTCCNVQLDAFSCPAVTASLHTAEAKLVEQQQQLGTSVTDSALLLAFP